MPMPMPMPSTANAGTSMCRMWKEIQVQLGTIVTHDRGTWQGKGKLNPGKINNYLLSIPRGMPAKRKLQIQAF